MKLIIISFALIFTLPVGSLSQTDQILITGNYANVKLGSAAQQKELKALEEAAELARTQGLTVYAGHGLNLANVRDVVRIGPVEELNIGHSIVSRAVLTGLERAVKEMQAKIREAF